MKITSGTCVLGTASVAHAGAHTRAAFIRKTYGHLAGAILAFTGVEFLLLHSPLAAKIVSAMTVDRLSWIIILGLFMGVSWIADAWARSTTSRLMQYAGLCLYVVAEAVIFVPLLYMASMYAPQVIPMAGIMTLVLTAGLTGTVVITKKDFSFLGPVLAIGGMVAFGIILISCVAGFNLGLLFSGGMVLFAAGAIIYSTSNILNQYREDQYVAASLSLFAAIALLFWYVINILLSIVNR